MNNGTKVRTALAVVVSIHTALMATDVTGFNNPTVDAIYKILSLAVNFVMVALVTYYNNDYTEQGEIGTILTRQLKQEDIYDIEFDENKYIITEKDIEEA